MKRLIIDVKPMVEGWAVEWRGFKRIHKFPAKNLAVNFAAFQAHEHETFGGVAQVVIRKKDNSIQSERTYGADPSSRKG